MMLMFLYTRQVETEIRDTVDLTLKTLQTLGLNDYRAQVSLRDQAVTNILETPLTGMRQKKP